ncbi:TolC family protein [Aliiglaciecola lipolytica]|uniref:Outer membrane cation efflux protein n=1 Tax=Aliiglaciecola lipolytica E3 TaxID=1127673 RepID=K6YNK1_9ALTE|nr:TolC family protein [Aliiglaciecola lipolytica]GAC12905.1 outer membrane cation efflux protein [Aliiglaciecola lipolytica E3]
MFRFSFLIFFMCASVFAQASSVRQLTLHETIQLAIDNDPWQAGNQLEKQALESQSMAADTLPDPVLSMGLLNLPTNGFAFDQEAMTQMKVGIAQQFPRGDSRGIRKRQLQQLAAKYPYLAKDREAQVAVTVSQLWLDGFAAQLSMQLLQQERGLFEQLEKTVESQYSSAQKRTSQGDVIRANLEISRLQDRLTQLQSDKETAIAALQQWISDDTNESENLSTVEFVNRSATVDYLSELAVFENAVFDRQRFAQMLSTHPAVLALEQTILAGQVGVTLEQQKYQPQWGVNASYAFRADDQAGQSRADFFSIGVSVDLPLFTHQRQDKSVQAAKYRAEALKTEKRLLLRNMLAQLDALLTQRQRLTDRLANYDQTILPQMHEQAEATLTAYTNDSGDFAEVMRARIAELNARLERVVIETKKLKVNAHLAYFLENSSSPATESQSHNFGEQP